jgi:hypothetical protein
MRAALLSQILSNHLEKKEQGDKPCSKNCVDPISPKNFGFDLD